jgi:type II secretory pathway component PulF
MPKFYYKAKDKTGMIQKGFIEAKSQFEAKKNLTDNNLFVVQIGTGFSVELQEKIGQFFTRITEHVSLEELIVFNRQLQTSYSVGISMVQALNLIGDQTDNPKLKRVVKSLVDDLSEGHALHEAMQKHPGVFDPIYVNAVKAGESSGKLDEIFSMLCYFAEQKLENEGKIKGATLYPKIIVATIGVVILVVVTFVMPKLKEFYGRFGGQLPPITVFVMGISEFVIGYWYLLIILAIGIYYSWNKFIHTPKGKLLWHKFQLKIPIFGAIYLQSDLLTFATVMRLLMQSGLPIIESFDVVRDSLRNQVLKNEIEECKMAVESGRSVASGFSQSKVIPKMVGNLLTVGEESGKVDQVLEKVGSYYKLQLEFRLNNLSKAIEPFFLVLIFGIVLVLVLSVFLPIWKMSQVMRMK